MCLVYLQDIESTRGADVVESNWFHRGWTLQELIAPSYVLFYNQDWKYCGSRNGHKPGDRYVEKNNFSHAIAKRTNIDKELLRSNDINETRRLLSTIPACQKMSWASDRVTTKEEDTAYCLIGIFGIHHLPLSYGEGCHAFIRLQEEITKQRSDLTLFAWTVEDTESCSRGNVLHPRAAEQQAGNPCQFEEELHSIFACHPREFARCKDIKPIRSTVYNDEIAVTSKGLQFVTPRSRSGPEGIFDVPLYCVDERDARIHMYLRWIGGDIFARTRIRKRSEAQRPHRQPGHYFPKDYRIHIISDIHRVDQDIWKLHHDAIHLPKRLTDGSNGKYFIERRVVEPKHLWMEEKELFMTYGLRHPAGCARYKRNSRTSKESCSVWLIFGLNDVQEPWFHVVTPDSHLAPHLNEHPEDHISRVWKDAYATGGSFFKSTFSETENSSKVTIEGTIESKTIRNPARSHEPRFSVLTEVCEPHSTTRPQSSPHPSMMKSSLFTKPMLHRANIDSSAAERQVSFSSYDHGVIDNVAELARYIPRGTKRRSPWND